MSGRFRNVAMFEEILGGGAVLKLGDKGPAVRVLQEALRDMGFPMLVLRGGVGESGVDGAFGAQTETALKNFQVHASKKRPNVEPHGRLDASTLQALKELAPAEGHTSWDSGQPNHAPIAVWKADPRRRLRVIVVKDEHRTFLYDPDGNCTGIFPNAHGTTGSGTDVGLKRIRTKLGEDDARAAGRDRWKTDKAFGKRILDLSWASGKSSGEELHGTYDYANMGKDVSHGCVRHYNEHIVAIFDSVAAGDYVAIVSSRDDPSLGA